MGMKSTSSATPSSDMKRVISTAVSGKYSCLTTQSSLPGRCGSSRRVVVQDPGEDARRVEARAAEPIDGAVGRDQRGRLEVADQPVIGNRRRGHLALRARASRRLGFGECHAC